FGKQRGDARVAGEAALLAAATGYRPGESRSDGVGLAGEVVAVERQARLEPERIPRAEPGGLHLGLGAEQVGDPFGVGRCEGKLEPVLAGIAGAADPGRGPGDLEPATSHEGERRQRPLAGRVPLEHRESRGALEREQRAILEEFQRDPARQALAHPVHIAALGGAVDDEVEPLPPARNDQVVDDPAVVVEQQRIAQRPVLERGEVDREQRFERGLGALAGDEELPHVRDVEQSCTRAGPFVLGDDALELYGHRIAGERHHAPAAGAVPGVERQQLEILVAHRGIPRHGRRCPRRTSSPAPPLSGNLRAWRTIRGIARLPLRWDDDTAARFPERSPRRGPLRLRDSGAVAPSAIRSVPDPLPRQGPEPRDSAERIDHGPTTIFRQVLANRRRRGDTFAPMSRLVLRWFTVLLAFALSAPAAAHPVPFSYLDLEVSDGAVDGRIRVHLTDIAPVLG